MYMYTEHVQYMHTYMWCTMHVIVHVHVQCTMYMYLSFLMHHAYTLICTCTVNMYTVLHKKRPKTTIFGCHAEVAGVCLMKVGSHILLMSRSTVPHFQTSTPMFRKIPCLNHSPESC